MKQKCKTCGKNSESEYCFLHKQKKALKSRSTPALFKKTDTNDDVPQLSEMNKFFLKIWNKKPHKSEVSGETLYSPPSSAYFHHILPKNKYPNLCFIEENIVILTLDEHTNVESNIYKYEEINRRREYLREKYNV